jgi:hypothetical protein
MCTQVSWQKLQQQVSWQKNGALDFECRWELEIATALAAMGSRQAGPKGGNGGLFSRAPLAMLLHCLSET